MKFTNTGTTTYTAQWKANPAAAKTGTIAYAGGGHTGGSVPTSHTLNVPGSANLKAPGNLTKSGYTFNGWKSSSSGTVFAAGATVKFTSTGTTTYTAQWKAKASTPTGTTVSSGKGTRAQYGAMNFAYPLPSGNKTCNSPFGPRGTWYPKSPKHAGIDIDASTGQPLYAVDNGYVKRNTKEESGAGFYIVIEIDTVDPVTKKKLQVTYMHMQKKSSLAEKTRVTKGQLIGYSGATGGNYGPHLHFQVCNAGYMGKKPEYKTMINPAWFWPGMSYKDNTDRGYTNQKFLEVLYRDYK